MILSRGAIDVCPGGGARVGSHLLQHCHQAGLHLCHMYMHLRRLPQADKYPFIAPPAVKTKPVQTEWPHR